MEDDAKVARALEDGLKAERYDVAVATTGEDDFFRASAEIFDVVVLARVRNGPVAAASLLPTSFV